MADKPTITISAQWQGGMKFTSRDGHDHELVTDAPVGKDDPFEGFMPAYLLLASLAGCTGIDVIDILKKQRQKVTGLEIRVTGTQQPHEPWAYEEIHVEYVVRGYALREGAVKRAIELSENKYCSVGATIGARAQITSSFLIDEEGP